MTFRKVAITSVATIFVAPAAFSQSLHFGVFGGLGKSDVPQEAYDEVVQGAAQVVLGGIVGIDDSSTDESSPAWGIQVGYSWGSHVAVEVGYVDLGSYFYKAEMDSSIVGPFVAEFKHESSGPTLALLGMYPVNEKFGVHARAGLLFSDTRITFSIDDESEGLKGSDTDATFGLGASWNVNDSYALRLEFQRFLDVGNEDDTGEEDVNLFSATLLFR